MWAKIKPYITGPYKYQVEDLDRYDKLTQLLIRKPWIPVALGAILGLGLGLLCAVTI